MTPPEPARFPTTLALILFAVCLVSTTWYFWPIRGVVLPLEALGALFIAFLSVPPVYRWLGSVPPAHRLVFFLLLAAVVRGHFTLSTRTCFPFVAWDIFSSVSEQETVFCRELIGTTASDRKVRLLVEQLFPSIVQFDLPPAAAPEKMEKLVAALVQEYNARHAADPVREVDLMLMAVKLHLPPGQTRSQPSCELLQRFELSPVHSS